MKVVLGVYLFHYSSSSWKWECFWPALCKAAWLYLSKVHASKWHFALLVFCSRDDDHFCSHFLTVATQTFLGLITILLWTSTCSHKWVSKHIVPLMSINFQLRKGIMDDVIWEFPWSVINNITEFKWTQTMSLNLLWSIELSVKSPCLWACFQSYLQSKEILLNLSMKCWNSAFNALGLRLIIVVIAVEALRKKKRYDETQFTTKIGGKTSLSYSVL
jgi:hypothetical protein